jgi:hypothetical protein
VILMISINKIEVLDLFSTKFLQIRFTVNDTNEDLTIYKFNIYKSNSPTDGFSLIVPDIKNFSYFDYDVIYIYQQLVIIIKLELLIHLVKK